MESERALPRVHDELKRILREHGLSDTKLLVAVSGGPDSLTLLIALSSVSPELGMELHGAHLDHGLRGQDSEADARFVADTCQEIGVGLTTGRADVNALKTKLRMSTEAAAREARYEFLGRVAAEQGAEAVALGHTADDQAETVLMNIIRGSGLVGLRGMETVTHREIAGSGVLLVRPLLGLARHDTEAYCRELGLLPRRDKSNLDLDATRNRVRLELLPLLRGYNPGIEKALRRLSRTAGAQVSHLDSEVDRVWSETAREADGTVSIRRTEFLRLSQAVQAHLLRRAVSLVKGDVQGIEQVHIDAMAALIAGASGKSLDLPGGVRFGVGYETGTVTGPRSHHAPPLPIVGGHPLAVPGATTVAGWSVVARVVAPHPESSSETGEATTALSPPHPSPLPRRGEGTRPSTHAPFMDQGSTSETRSRGEVVKGESPAPEASTDDSLHADRLTAYLDLDALGGELEVRARKSGDRFQPLGMSGHKKLQDFMVDAKVPQPSRDSVPLVVSPKGIAWVVGWRIAEWAKVGEGTRRVAELSFVRR